MDRRNFLKALGGAAAVSAASGIPIEILEGHEPALIEGQIGTFEGFEFVETIEYGNVLEWSSWNWPHDPLPSETMGHFLDILLTDARRVLPPGTRFDIRRKTPTDYGREHGIAWYYSPGHLLHPAWAITLDRTGKGVFDETRGVYIVGRQLA